MSKDVHKNHKREGCLFCKIIKRKIPAHIIHESKNSLAFLDKYPVSDGHILVVPKKHVVWIQDADDKTITEIFKVSNKLIRTLIKALKCDYVSLSVGGIHVPHLHIHLIPRYLNDKLPRYPSKGYESKVQTKIAKKIISKL